MSSPPKPDIVPRLVETPTPTTSSSERKVSALKRFRYKLEAFFLELVSWLILRLPFKSMLRFADAIGWITYHLLRQDRKVALANIEIAFGDTKTPPEKKHLAKAAFRNLSRALVSLFWAPNVTAANYRDYCEIQPESDALMKSLQAQGRGVLLCSPHLGNWELGAVVIGYLGTEMMIVGEPTRNPAVGDKIFKLRGVSGHKIIPPHNAVLKLFRHVSRGGAVAMLVDVNGRRKRGGVWCDYFGLPVFNSSAVAELALRTGAAILIGVGRPMPDGRVRIEYIHPVETKETGDRAADIQRITQDVTTAVEKLVREDPEKWLWTYKRWKRRPAPERGKFPFYSKFQEVD